MRAPKSLGPVLLAAAAALGACESTPPPPPAPGLDGSLRRDAGALDANVARADTGVRPPPEVDGRVEEAEWRGALVAEAERPSDRPGSVLSSLRARIVGERLYVAVQGTLAPGDALALYVDRDLGSASGVTPSQLTDSEGVLDALLAQRELVVPSAMRLDFAWGTARMPHAAEGLDDAAGWRNLGDRPERFNGVAAERAPSVCGTDACETFIPLGELGGRAPRRIALFARLVRADGGLTDQTLPEDDAARPERVGAWLELEDGRPDAGVLDAGVDAGGPAVGVVVDGVIGADEWAEASVYPNAISAAGIFAGSALRSLRALREGSRLYVGIEATLGADQAIAMYVDADVGGFDGLVSPTPLDDFAGALDRALSKELVTPAEIRIDLAWGTLQMSRAAGAIDDRMGWRDVATNPDEFRAIDGTRAPSACSENACETSIELATLGVPPGATIGVFVRLVSSTTVAFSNQTLPMDNPAIPELIDAVAFVRP